jgi:pimeloyl-ACP methyl ester carboxylesterase
MNDDNDDHIWTLSMNEKNDNIPIVMIAGFGAGIGFWAKNLEEISDDRPLYAFDVLGFSQSSRPIFPQDPKEIEEYFIKSIEKWREAMKIEKMILLGHSFGGFLSSSYTLKYPEKIEHLILVDAWGHDETPDFQDFPLWKKSVAYSVRVILPFSMMRSFGEKLIKTCRPDLLEKFTDVVDEFTASQYINHCNNKNPSGEEAFHRFTIVGPW